jgi:hypothetical protein
MDPTACLKRLRELMDEYNRGESVDSHEIVELFYSLDKWITRGGSLPKQWVEPKGMYTFR